MLERNGLRAVPFIDIFCPIDYSKKKRKRGLL